MKSFKTNIKCNGCVDEVKPYLDGLKEIKSWHVNLDSPHRILSVEGETGDDDIIVAISAAGYAAEKIQ